jgi:hypothetical protein
VVGGDGIQGGGDGNLLESIRCALYLPVPDARSASTSAAALEEDLRAAVPHIYLLKVRPSSLDPLHFAPAVTPPPSDLSNRPLSSSP